MNRIYACPVADVPEGEALRIDTSPVIALFNVGGEFYAINDRCSHGNASMSEGYLEDDATVECPLHAASFCLKTGKALCLPATDPLTTYPVHVEGGDIFIDLVRRTVGIGRCCYVVLIQIVDGDVELMRHITASVVCP